MIKKIFSEFETLKLKLIEDNLLIIENYQKIKEVTDTIFVIDQYQIKGKQLLITFINTSKLYLEGKIEEIKII